MLSCIIDENTSVHLFRGQLSISKFIMSLPFDSAGAQGWLPFLTIVTAYED